MSEQLISELMSEPQQTKITKDQITDDVYKNKTFRSMLNMFNDGKREAFMYTIQSNREWSNGLLTKFVVIELNGKIDQVIVPIFSTEKTVTWSINYIKVINKTLEASGKSTDGIGNLIKCALFFMDKSSYEITFLSAVKLSDWIDNGSKGKNGTSVYFWNDRLPNEWSLNKSKISSEITVNSFPQMNKKQLTKFCSDYANEHFKKFSNTAEKKRSDATMIKNISKGLYAQIWLYVELLKQGKNVEMNWIGSDDLGIDIIYSEGEYSVNLDVKSTSDDYLKISKNRKETNFYAVIKWEGQRPLLLGYLPKYQFWPGKFGVQTKPEEIDGMYRKRLTKKWMKESFLKLEKIVPYQKEIRSKQLKQKETLFEK